MKRALLTPGLVLALSLVLAARPVHAEPERTWYGWELLLVDATLVGVALSAQKPAPLFGVFLSGPVTHFANGRPAMGVGSLLARATLPLVGGAIAQAACEPDPGEWFGCLEAAGKGVAVGYVVALAVDLCLATKEVEPPAPVAPVLSLGPGGALAGVRIDF